MQRLDKISAQKTSPKVPEWPSYFNLSKITQNRHFLNKYKRGTKRNFSKIAQKVALAWKAQKKSIANGFLLYLVCTSSANIGEDYGAKKGSKSARMAQLRKFSPAHPKPAFSEKDQRGDQEKFYKNRPKRCPRWKGPKELWRKWHYPVIIIKDWRRFRRERHLQKCPNGQVMAI